MKITKISASYDRKVQIERFEPIAHTVELNAVLDPDEDPDEAYDALADMAEDMVERQLAERIAAAKLEEDSE